MSGRRMLAVAAVAAPAWASLAAASAVPVTPARNAVLHTSTPTFTWRVPAGETTTNVFVASSPRTGTGGSIPSQNVVDNQAFSNGETRWTPTRPLFAARYWWSVKTKTGDGKALFSAPRPFRIKAVGKITNLRLTRYTSSHRLFVSAKWRVNTKTSSLTLRVRSAGSRVVWTYRLPAVSIVPGEEEFGISSWQSEAHVPSGTRTKLTATLQAGSFVQTLTRPFAAP